jgi:hypothetical protein
MASGMTTPNERRQAPRVAERVSVAITEAGEAVRTETTNLSTSGAYCTLERFIPPMTKLQLQFELPNGGRRVHVECTGVVVRVEPVIATPEQGRYHVAIFFTDMTERNRSAIATFVRERLAAKASAGS